MKTDLDPIDTFVMTVARRTGLLLWRWTELFFEAFDLVRKGVTQGFSSRRSSGSSDPEQTASPPGSAEPTEPCPDPDRRP